MFNKHNLYLGFGRVEIFYYATGLGKKATQ